MIGDLWDLIVAKMTALGYTLAADEAGSLVARSYTVALPGDQRDTSGSTIGKARVVRDIRIRVQFPERKDARYQLQVSQDVEEIVTTLRGAGWFSFDSWSAQGRPGGLIAEIRMTARDSMN